MRAPWALLAVLLPGVAYAQQPEQADPAPPEPQLLPNQDEHKESPPAPASAPLPPPVHYEPPPEPVRAPKYSMWTGGRLGVLGFGQLFYAQDRGAAKTDETTGNFAGPGLGAEVNIGARLGYRYTPFLLFEHGFMSRGNRFAGSDASTSTDLFGLGFRLIAGSPHSVAFASELSVGVRTLTIKSNGETYRMSGIEIFRLGLGVEVRVSKLFTLTPMASIVGGSFTDTKGNVHFSPEGSRDGILEPQFRNGDRIATDNQRSYLVFGLGCGGYFDVFGK